MQQARLRVCYFGTYRANYARNTIIIEGLRKVGVEVVECHETLWQSFEDRERTASGGWLRPSFWLRVLRTYWRLLVRYLRTPKDFDVMVVGYPGQFDIFLARLLSWWQRKPLVWDVLMSIYLICVERGLDKRSPLTVAVIRMAERLACHTPDMLILDTQAYVDWFCKTYEVEPARFRRVPLCADERSFPAVDSWHPEAAGERFRVLYYGTYIPNHGVPYIVEAARLLSDLPAIQFEFIGGGPQRELAVKLAEDYQLSNVHFYGWLDKGELGEHIAQADLCLGTFGATPQSLMTVQNKIYEAMAMGRPVLTGASPAVRESLIPGEHLFVCERADPTALAQAIRHIYAHPRLSAAVAAQGQRHYQRHYSVLRSSERFAEHLCSLVARHRR